MGSSGGGSRDSLQLLNVRGKICRTLNRWVGEAVDHQGQREVEAIVALAGGELGSVAGGVREGLGRQGGEPAEQFVAVDDPRRVVVGRSPARDRRLEAV